MPDRKRTRGSCFTHVEESEDFSLRAKRGGKVSVDVIGDKRTRDPNSHFNLIKI